jgi:hypothetical protein
LATLARLTRAGLRAQAAVSPVLPCNPERFAALLDGRVARVLLDTFFAGDGSGGARTIRLGVGEIFQHLGYADWFKPDAHLGLLEALKKHFPPEKIVFSQEGFAAV